MYLESYWIKHLDLCFYPKHGRHHLFCSQLTFCFVQFLPLRSLISFISLSLSLHSGFMASTLTFNCSLAAPIRASSGSARKPDLNRRKTASSTWWAPLFGWPSEPDYVNANGTVGSDPQSKIPDSESELDRPRSKFTLGCFTEEKARQLRKKTVESSSFHDIMYHSAIASRLASDVSDCPISKSKLKIPVSPQ